MKNKIPLTNIILFLLTLITTFFSGSIWETNDIPLTFGNFLKGWVFAVPLLLILFCHEMGHFFAAKYHKIPATLPYFIPFPFFFGTMGAVIKIKERIKSRNALMDIGAAGPLAGLIVTMPVLLWGIYKSPVLPITNQLHIQEGHCLLYKFLIFIVHGNIPSGYDIYLNSTALAGWVGMFVTMLNLFPVGQLDGGHIAYALFGEKQNIYSKIIHYSLLFLGIFLCLFYGIKAYNMGLRGENLFSEFSVGFNWIVWAGVLKLLKKFSGKYHPPVDDNTITKGRKIIGIITLILFFLLFMPVPMKSEGV